LLCTLRSSAVSDIYTTEAASLKDYRGVYYMFFILHPRWQYVYWLVVFSFYLFLTAILRQFVESVTTDIAVPLVTLLCLSVGATFIERKIAWGIWNIV